MVNWEAVGAVAEGLGAVVVVISLAYLALQVKQANLQAQGIAYADWFTTWNDTIKGLIRDRDTVRVMQHGFADFHGLPHVDKAIFAQQLAATINHWHLAAELAERGLIDDHLYQGATNIVLSLCATPGGRQYFEVSAAGFPRGPQLLRMLESDERVLPPFNVLNSWWSIDEVSDEQPQEDH